MLAIVVIALAKSFFAGGGGSSNASNQATVSDFFACSDYQKIDHDINTGVTPSTTLTNDAIKYGEDASVSSIRAGAKQMKISFQEPNQSLFVNSMAIAIVEFKSGCAKLTN